MIEVIGHGGFGKVNYIENRFGKFKIRKQKRYLHSSKSQKQE
jgi:hypothetical protein